MRHPALVDDSLEFRPWTRQLAKATTRILATLTPREERAVRLYFWTEGATYDAVGEQFNIGKARAQQIVARALRKMKHPSRSRYLRPFLDDGPIHGPLRRLETVVVSQGKVMPRDALPGMLPPPKLEPAPPVKRDVIKLGKSYVAWPPTYHDPLEMLRQAREAEREEKEAARMNVHWLAILAAYGGTPVYGPYGYIINVKRND